MSRSVLAIIGAFLALDLLLVLLLVRRRATRSARPKRDVFRALREVGVDAAQPTEVSYYLYFPTLRAAESASAQVAALRIDAPKLAVRIERAAMGTAWLCLVTTHAIPSERAIHAACTELGEVAAEYGGELDGWEVAVTW